MSVRLSDAADLLRAARHEGSMAVDDERARHEGKSLRFGLIWRGQRPRRGVITMRTLSEGRRRRWVS